MKIDYTYRKTASIEKSIVKIEVAKNVIEILPQLPHIEEHLRYKSLLKSSLFSARIEGNRLRLEEIENSGRGASKDREKKKVAKDTRQFFALQFKDVTKQRFYQKTRFHTGSLVCAKVKDDIIVFNENFGDWVRWTYRVKGC